MRVLIVEDHENMARLMEASLQIILAAFPGSIVTITPSLAAAKETIRANPPDLIVLDLALSDSGLQQTLSEVHEMNKQSPLVIVTGNWQQMESHEGASVVRKDDNLWKTFPLTIARALLGRPWGSWAKAEKAHDRMVEIENLLKNGGEG